MFGSTLFEVVIGLALMFLVLSMTASAMVEYLSSLLQKRGKNLLVFMRQLLAPSDSVRMASESMVRSFYENTILGPSIKSNVPPPYVASDQFVQALFGFLSFRYRNDAKVEELRAIANNLGPGTPLRDLLLTAVERSDGQVNQAAIYLEDWFNGQMRAVSSWYKRWTQRWLVGIGMVMAITFNIDTFRFVDALLREPALRQAIVAEAQTTANETNTDGTVLDLQRAVEGIGLPIGWPEEPDAEEGLWWYLRKIAGLAITGFGVSQGAPFWFDLLNRITNLRSSVRPPEEEPTTGSGTSVPWRT
jgi:hypothetical protein